MVNLNVFYGIDLRLGLLGLTNRISLWGGVIIRLTNRTLPNGGKLLLDCLTGPHLGGGELLLDGLMGPHLGVGGLLLGRLITYPLGGGVIIS